MTELPIRFKRLIEESAITPGFWGNPAQFEYNFFRMSYYSSSSNTIIKVPL